MDVLDLLRKAINSNGASAYRAATLLASYKVKSIDNYTFRFVSSDNEKVIFSLTDNDKYHWDNERVKYYTSYSAFTNGNFIEVNPYPVVTTKYKPKTVIPNKEYFDNALMSMAAPILMKQKEMTYDQLLDWLLKEGIIKTKKDDLHEVFYDLMDCIDDFEEVLDSCEKFESDKFYFEYEDDSGSMADGQYYHKYMKLTDKSTGQYYLIQYTGIYSSWGAGESIDSLLDYNVVEVKGINEYSYRQLEFSKD